MLATQGRVVVHSCSRRRRLPTLGPSVSLSSDITLNSRSLSHHVSSTPRCTAKLPTRLGVMYKRQLHATTLHLSENLLGHSPMARSVPTTSQQAASPSPAPSNQGPVWGTDSNTAGGGVWAQTSAKKDKLNELLTELNADGVDTGKFYLLRIIHDVRISPYIAVSHSHVT